MNRRDLLRRAGAGMAALLVGPRALAQLAPAGGLAEDLAAARSADLAAAAAALEKAMPVVGSSWASGGLCVPVSPYYELTHVGRLIDAPWPGDAPVHASLLPEFGADHGIRFARRP